MSKRILVVEDQEDNRQILRDLLNGVGYQILEAEDGVRGVAAAETERPDLILMDIQLPLVDGYEATRRIKANPALRAIPIIVVTSYALSGDEDKARAAGCDDYITSRTAPARCWRKSTNICARERRGIFRCTNLRAFSSSTTVRPIATFSARACASRAMRSSTPQMGKRRWRPPGNTIRI
jgi:two-component system, cell cycle response regulator DivK